MKIESAAGEFEFHIETLKVTGNDVIIVGKMGVWEAETSMDRDDVLKLLRLTAGNPSFWRFSLKLLPYAVFGRKRGRRREMNE